MIHPTQEDECSWKTQDGKMTKKMSGETVHSHCYAILFSSFCRCVRLRFFIAPAGFWPLGQNPRRHYRNPRVIENMSGIAGKNLESQEQGPQRICG